MSTVSHLHIFLSWMLVILFMAPTINYKYIRIILGVFSAIAGLIFLSKSSFFATQFDDTKRSEILVFAILSALLVFLVFVTPSWSDLLQKVRNLNFSVKAMVDSLFLGIVWLLAFLIKYPRFNVHSRFIKSCNIKDQGKILSRGNQYNLYSVGAFSLLSLLLSLERQKSMELGFFGVLIGLIMDTSLEIPGSDDEPNLWYILGSILYCIGLVFLKRYVQSLREKGKSVLPLKRGKNRSVRDIFRNSLVYFSAMVGIVCLFWSSFSEQQFENASNFKVICFLIFSLMLGSFLPNAPKFSDTLVTKCQGQFLVKAMVKCFLFVIVSGVIFMTKYPRFKIHSQNRESCNEKRREKKLYQGNEFDVYASGSFSLFALTMSSEREQPVKLGIFSFLLELTMDTSIEILGNDKPNVLCMLGASIFCALLILVKSYLDSSTESRDYSVGQHGRYNDQLEVAMVSNVGDKSYVDEQPLIERKTGGKKGHEIEDHELTAGETDDTIVVVGDNSGIIREDAEVGNESSTDVVYGVLSPMDKETKLLNRRERQIAKKREKAKRGKERKKEQKMQKEDLWIS